MSSLRRSHQIGPGVRNLSDNLPPLKTASTELRDKEAIIETLLKCDICSSLIVNPVTLPCGNSLCRECLPGSYERHISNLGAEDRSQAIKCPFEKCEKEHALADIASDITLRKALAAAGDVMAEIPQTLDLLDHPVGTAVFDRLRDAVREELKCQVCLVLLFDSFTTPCGHTFCRECIQRTLDHNTICPTCRRGLHLPPNVNKTDAPANKRLTEMLEALFPSETEARVRNQFRLEDMDIPLFVCTLSFPKMPTFLHIFEPRYRTMIRRVMASEDRKFGMVLGNPMRLPQGDLGPVNFYQYGTMLRIVNHQILPDGRSMLETVGLTRFKVIRHGVLDGYTIGKVERVDDISAEEEDRLETSEVNARVLRTDDERYQSGVRLPNLYGRAPSDSLGERDLGALNPGSLNTYRITESELKYLPTTELLRTIGDFIMRQSSKNRPWMHQRVAAAYGHPPFSSPQDMPWWLASIFPVAEHQKYRLLCSNSVRERLRICAGWCLAWEEEEKNSGLNLAANCRLF